MRLKEDSDDVLPLVGTMTAASRGPNQAAAIYSAGCLSMDTEIILLFNVCGNLSCAMKNYENVHKCNEKKKQG